MIDVSFLIYGHIGTAVHLDASAPNAFRIDPVGVRVGDHAEIVESGLAKLDSECRCAASDFNFNDPITPITVIRLVMRIFVPFVRDHFTSRYFFNLNRINGSKRIKIVPEDSNEIVSKIERYLLYGPKAEEVYRHNQEEPAIPLQQMILEFLPIKEVSRMTMTHTRMQSSLVKGTVAPRRQMGKQSPFSWSNAYR